MSVTGQRHILLASRSLAFVNYTGRPLPPSAITLKLQNRQLSIVAENLVARALEKQGWNILARNFRYIGCELDIVARKCETLIIVEVKARRRKPSILQDALQLLPARKRAALYRGSQIVASRLADQSKTIRIDLALVYPDLQKKPTIEYYVNVLS